MTTPKSRLSYKMHFDILDRAMSDPKGIRIRMSDHGQAWRMRLEIHHARKIDRDDNETTYDEGHMLHGCSVYDQLLATIEVDDHKQTWLYVHKRDANAFHIEELSTIDKTQTIDELPEERVTEVLMAQDFKTELPVLEEATELERRF